MRGAGAGGASLLRQSFLFCSFLFHSRRSRGPSLARISACLRHRLPAAVARPASSPRVASLTFCYFLASLLRLPASRPPACSLLLLLLLRTPRPARGPRPPPSSRRPRAAALGDVLRPERRQPRATLPAAACALEPERGLAGDPAGPGHRGARARGARPLGCFVNSAVKSRGSRAFLPRGGRGRLCVVSAAAERGGGGGARPRGCWAPSPVRGTGP